MRAFSMENFFRKTKMNGILSALLIATMLGACSSKQGVEDAAAGDEVKSEEELMLGEEADALNDELSATAEDSESLEDDLGTPTAEIISSSENFSRPTNIKKSTWKGILKSQYVPGMSHWTVSRGESLSMISQAVFGSARDYKKLMSLNPQLTDPNMLEVGQKLRLPGSESAVEQVGKAEESATNETVAVAPTAPSAPAPSAPAQDQGSTSTTTDSAAPDTATAPNNAVDPATPAPSEAAGNGEAPPAAAGTVEAATPPPATEEAAPVAAAPAQTELGGMVKRVEMGGNQLKLRNILLGVAAFFLLLSGVIFVLSRKKTKAG